MIQSFNNLRRTFMEKQSLRLPLSYEQKYLTYSEFKEEKSVIGKVSLK